MITAVIAAVAVISTLVQIGLLERIAAGAQPTEAEIAASDTRQSIIGIAQFCVFVATVVSFCRWMYRAYHNLVPLDPAPLMYTPGGAVGSFFIPFVNLVRPYRAMTELWHRSGRAVFASVEKMPSVGLVQTWWGLYLAMGLLGNAVMRFGTGAKTASELVTFSWLMVVSDGFDIVAAVPALLLIRRVTAMQEAQRAGEGAMMAAE